MNNENAKPKWGGRRRRRTSQVRSFFKEYFIKGRTYWNLTFIKILDDYVAPSGKRHPMGLFQCKCGTKKPIRLHYVYDGKIKGCGCMRGSKEFKDKNILGDEIQGI